jgi:hypothetical protein
MDNGGRPCTNTPVSPTEYFNLTAQGAAVLSVPTSANLNSLVLASNSALLITNGTVTVLSNAIVQTGAAILGDGSGFLGSAGNGAGRSFYYYPPSGGNGLYVGGGAGHGGYGAASLAGGGGITYDTFVNPTVAGSGGGTGSDFAPTNAGGAGGGIIRLTVNGTLQLDGRLSADGLTPLNHNSGGGSGGSIVVSVGTLSGSGLISANGGAGTGAEVGELPSRIRAICSPAACGPGVAVRLRI